jgi:peptidoglycan/LPS O-acetylase OafA/YrhL
LAFGIVALCFANGAGRYLINNVITQIGRFSFSIYLLHWLAIGRVLSLTSAIQIGAGTRFFFLFCGTTALTTALAAITYFAIELPMIRLGNRLITRMLVPSRESSPALLTSALSQMQSPAPETVPPLK